MSIGLQTAGIHHLALRTTDLARAHTFYGRTLGLPIVLEARVAFVVLAGSTVVVIQGPEAQATADRRLPLRVGLDHVALACATEAELARAAGALEAAKVPSTGLRLDPLLKRPYVGFIDPDGIAWQLYMAPEIAQP